jgi:hypothetical protein
MPKARRVRKRTKKEVPAKGRCRDIADKLWSRAVRDAWANKCAVCGKQPVDAHHLFPRQHEATRYMLLNGIALCSHHHRWDPDLAPHQNGKGFDHWLRETHYPRWEWMEEACDERLPQSFSGTVNLVYFCEVITGFRSRFTQDEFKKIVGINFNNYLLEHY